MQVTCLVGTISVGVRILSSQFSSSHRTRQWTVNQRAEFKKMQLGVWVFCYFIAQT